MRVLVTGATGNVGRNVVRFLRARGVEVRAVTRDPGRARLPGDVEVIEGDMVEPDRLAGVFGDVDAMFLFPLTYLLPVLTGFGDVVDSRAMVQPAADAGIRRIVTLTSDDGFRELEEIVEAAVPEWAHVRPGEFMANRLDMWADSIRSSDLVRTAHPDARGVPIHEADIAEVAAICLTDARRLGRAYTLTGPQALTLREQAAAIAEGIGRPIRFVEMTPDEARADLLALGVLPEVIDTEFVGGLAEQVGAHPEPASTFTEVTGRPGRTFVEWAADHEADFRPEGQR